MNIGSLCTRPAVALSLGASLANVAELMRDQHVGAIVVTQEGPDHAQVAGIITDRDIVRTQIHRASDLASLNAADAMTRSPLVIREGDSLGAAVAHLRSRGVRRAPVVTSAGVLVGVVSADDLLAHLAEEIAGMAGIVARQVRTEAA